MADQAINQCSSSNTASSETPESTLELNVKTLDSQTYTFQVNKNEIVSAFKEKIASEVGVPVGQQRLIFRGRVLKDDHPLSEYHLENGHTLHLVVRQPAESLPSSATPHEGTTANDGNGTNGGASRNRGHISHSVVLGSFNVGEQTEGIVPDLSRVIGAVLNSFGVGGQQPANNSNGTQPSMFSTLSGHTPPGNASDGAPAGIGVQSQATGHSQPRQAFLGPAFQGSFPHVVQIPVTAATTIPLPSLQVPIPDSLDTIMEFINRMEQALSQNGYQPDPSFPTGGQPRAELPRNRRIPSTPDALSVVLRNAQHLLSGLAVSSLSHIAGRLEQDGTSSDPAIRGQIQTEATQVGLAMQHLGALLLELGRTILTLRMAQSPELSYVNSGPAVYISPSGPNPIMVQPFPHQISPLFTGAAASSNPTTVPVGLGTAPRHINIHIHAGTSVSPMMSSVGNQQNNVEGGQGDRDSNTSSVRVLPVRNVVAAAVPSRSTDENISAGNQPGSPGISSLVSELNSEIRELVNNMQGRNQTAPETETSERDTSTGYGVASAIREQPNNIAPRTPEESSRPQPGLPAQQTNLMGQSDHNKGHGGEVLERPSSEKDISCSTGKSSAPCGESSSNGEDSTNDDKSTKKTSPTPLGLGLGGLERKKRSKQPKPSGTSEDSGTSAPSEGTQQGSVTGNQQLLQSLFSGSSAINRTPSNETARTSAQGSDDRVDVSSVMSQVLQSPALNGMLAGVSRQAGVDSPDVLRNMLQQFTQSPQIMNTVQQIAQQVDGQEIENMMSGGAQGGGGSFDFSRMIQQMMPLVSQAFSQGAQPTVSPNTQPCDRTTQQNDKPDDQQPSQVNVQSVAQMIEHSDPPEDVFRAMAEYAALNHEDLVNELCSDELLALEYAELLRRDIEDRLQDNQNP